MLLGGEWNEDQELTIGKMEAASIFEKSGFSGQVALEVCLEGDRENGRQGVYITFSRSFAYNRDQRHG